jgi:2-octaprenylphenol hydroxylase
MNDKKYDIVIVGAGMVGSLLAALLKSSGLKILLLERAVVSAPEKSDAFEPRVSALTRASENLLRHVGAWSTIENLRSCAYTAMTVWDADGTGRVQFNARELGETHLGVLVENRVLQWALTQAAIHTDTPAGNISLRCPVHLTALERLPDAWQLTFADGEKLQAQLVVGADGAQSAVRQMSGIAVRETDYAQRAIVATVRTENPHQFTAWQRFMPSGPLAFLPLQTAEGDAHHCSIVWSQDEKEAQRLLALDDDAFARELGFAFEHTLGGVEWVDRRYSFPLRALHAESYVREGIALIGDAAHAIHPLAGQGVNLGLLDAAVLAEEIMRALARDISWSSESTLSRYSRRRRAHNMLILKSMTGLQKLFSSQQPALLLLRNMGMSFTQSFLPLKQEFARVAMGLAGDLPMTAKIP